MRYRRILALLDAAVAELGEAALALEGHAYEVIDQTTFERAPAGRVGLVVYQPLEGAGEGEVAAIFARAGLAAEVSSTECDEESWRDAWKPYFKPRKVGPFVIVPSWERYQPAPGEVTLDLDPGRAFGTGGHASTRLCLEVIGEVAECTRFLDVGCGSGVLAVACARRWPHATGQAIDVDPEAIEVTRENAEKNNVSNRIAASTTPVGEIATTFDLVLANIQADVLCALAPALAARVAPGGRLIASGILVPQADAVAQSLVAAGLTLAGSRDEHTDADPADPAGVWRAITLTREA